MKNPEEQQREPLHSFDTKDLLEEALRRTNGFGSPDEDIRATAGRLLGVWKELGRGTQIPPPKLKWFQSDYHSLLIKGPMEAAFLCPHHLLPVMAKVALGVIPNEAGHVLGISKYTRVVEWACARFDLQENITSLIADTIWNVPAEFRPSGLCVAVSGDHFCEKIRGIKKTSPTITMEARGIYSQENRALLLKTILPTHEVRHE